MKKLLKLTLKLTLTLALIVATLMITGGCSNTEHPIVQNIENNEVVETTIPSGYEEIMEYQTQSYENVIIVFDHYKSKNHNYFWENEVEDIKMEHSTKEIKIVDLSKRDNRYAWINHNIEKLPHVVIK